MKKKYYELNSSKIYPTSPLIFMDAQYCYDIMFGSSNDFLGLATLTELLLVKYSDDGFYA